MFVMDERGKHKQRRSDSLSDAGNDYTRKKKHKHECVWLCVIRCVEFYTNKPPFVYNSSLFVSDNIGVLTKYQCSFW